MKLYVNKIDTNKSLVLYKIKYRISTVRNNRLDFYKYFVAYEEDIKDNLQIVDEFFRYLRRIYNSRDLCKKYLDVNINSVNFVEQLKVSYDSGGMYVNIEQENDKRNVAFSDSFFFVKNVIKVG